MVRVEELANGLYHHALAVEVPEGLVWFWIGTHDEYQRMINEDG